jgi:hypothetical protein
VSVTPHGLTTLTEFCGALPKQLNGNLNPSKLGSTLVPIKLDAGVCTSQVTEVRIPKKDIRGVKDTK